MSWPLFPALQSQLFSKFHQLFVLPPPPPSPSPNNSHTIFPMVNFYFLLFICCGRLVETRWFGKNIQFSVEMFESWPWLKWQTCNLLYMYKMYKLDIWQHILIFFVWGRLFGCLFAKLYLRFRSRTLYAMCGYKQSHSTFKSNVFDKNWTLNSVSLLLRPVHFPACLCVSKVIIESSKWLNKFKTHTHKNELLTGTRWIQNFFIRFCFVEFLFNTTRQKPMPINSCQKIINKILQKKWIFLWFLPLARFVHTFCANDFFFKMIQFNSQIVYFLVHLLLFFSNCSKICWFFFHIYWMNRGQKFVCNFSRN